MTIESATTINQLEPANPAGPDRLAQGDDHIRLIKACLKATFPNITGPVTLTHAAINAIAASLVPFGTIHLWYGAAVDIPVGYAQCNGVEVARSDLSGNVTPPDLRDRVVIGASGTLAVGATQGQNTRTVTSEAGGAHGHTGTLASAGAHTHPVPVSGLTLSSETPVITVTAPTHNVDGSGGFPVPSSVSAVQAAHTHSVTASDLTASSGGAHTHDATIDDAVGHTHAINNIDVRQPSLALHYIMKI